MNKRILIILCVLCALPHLSLTDERALPPYVLITPDYGILTLNDLQQEAAADAAPGPIVNGRPSGGLAWQCLPTNYITMECYETSFNESTHVQHYLPILKLLHDDQLYEFYPRRPWDEEVCKKTIAGWRDAIAGQEYACFSALYNGDPSLEEDSSHSEWIINRIKSLQGSWSYWAETDSEEEP